MKTALIIAAAIAALPLAAAAQDPSPAVEAAADPDAAPAPAPAPAFDPADWKELDPANTLVIDTTKGRIVVEMHPEMAPLHVARIKVLARQGYYNGSLFYRVPAFAAQGGDKNKTFRSPLPNLRDEFFFTLSAAMAFGPVGPSPQGDLGFVGAMPVLIDPDPARPTGHAPAGGRASVVYCPGVASFARGAAADSANSQIFFMKVRGTNLEKHFTAWGRVVKGYDVVTALNLGEPPPVPDRMTRVRVMADMPPVERPAVMVMDTRGAAFRALVAQAIKDKGPDFNVCDLAVPAR